MKPLLRPRSIGGSRLVQDYLREEAPALSFYAGSPFHLSSFQTKLDRVAERFTPDRRAAAAELLKPSSSVAAERLRRFVAEGGAMVTTGQQAGLLTGPLYTVYKAISAVALARHLEAQFGVIVLPVFWVASEDHDWVEVNHTHILDRSGRPHLFELSSLDRRAQPMSVRPLEGDLELLCDEVSQVVAAKGHAAEYVKRILDPYRRGGSVASAFGEALRSLLAEFDLCFADAADPALKAASLPVLREALERPQEHEAILRSRSEALRSCGYAGQVAVLEGATNVFHHSDAGRHRVYRRGGEFRWRERRTGVEAAELLGQLEREPCRFSPNVFLRPVVETHLFPTVAYVGGPGEVAYFGQVSALFGAFGMEAPVAVPRYSGDVLEPGTERVMASLGLRMEDLGESREVLVERVVRGEVPEGARRSLEDLRREIAAGFERLIDGAGGIDPTVGSALAASRNRVLAEIARAEWKVLRSLKRGDLESMRQLDRVLGSLRPEGKAQDRVLNVLSFLGRYGPHFLREVERAIRECWRLPVRG